MTARTPTAAGRLPAALAALALLAGGVGAAEAAVAPGAAPVVVTLRDQAPLAGITGPPAARLREVVRRRRARAAADLPAFAARLDAWRRAGRAGRVTPLWIVNGFALTATPDVVARLAADPAVASVTADANPIVPADAPPVEPNIVAVGAPERWGAGTTGQGVVVATLDTGVDPTDPDLAATWRGGANSWFDPYGQHPSAPADLNGHGTGVMGVITGGAAGGSAVGMAPGARWIAARVFDDAGGSTISATHQAFQWLLDPDGDPATSDAPQVVNASWSFASAGCFTEFAPDIAALRAAGILPVFAAGNFATQAQPEGTGASPANNPGAFAVGSLTAAEAVAVDSSRGPSDCGGRTGVFPDLAAPGVGVRTADRGGFFATVSGTSIAAPHASGALALLLSAHPGLPADQQAAALRQGARDLGAPGPDDVSGHGMLDVVAAEATLAATPDAIGPVTSGPAAAPAVAASGTVTLGAEALDAGGTVAGAEWFDGADPGAGGGTPMQAADGVFDAAAEGLTAAVDAGALAPGAHVLRLRARDDAGNWGAPAEVTLVVDRTGPEASGASASPGTAAGGTVTLTAQAQDAASAVAAAEWFTGPDPGPGAGTAMQATDGAFGGAAEGLRATIDAGALPPGTHALSVRARDALGTWGAAAQATLVVTRPAPSVTPTAPPAAPAPAAPAAPPAGATGGPPPEAPPAAVATAGPAARAAAARRRAALARRRAAARRAAARRAAALRRARAHRRALSARRLQRARRPRAVRR